jgi:hypothetical protein
MSKYIVRKDFKFGGRNLIAGNPFNWRRMACNQRKLDTLVATGLVEEVGSVQVVEPVAEEQEIVTEVDYEEEEYDDEDEDA